MKDKQFSKQLLVAIAAIRDESGRILLQKRVDHKIIEANEKWEFPGGKVNFNESAEEAIIREVFEETSCKIKIIRMLPIVHSKVWKTTNGDQIHALVVGYEAELIDGVATPSDSKVSEVKWFSLHEIDALDLLHGMDKFIDLIK